MSYYQYKSWQHNLMVQKAAYVVVSIHFIVGVLIFFVNFHSDSTILLSINTRLNNSYLDVIMEQESAVELSVSADVIDRSPLVSSEVTKDSVAVFKSSATQGVIKKKKNTEAKKNMTKDTFQGSERLQKKSETQKLQPVAVDKIGGKEANKVFADGSKSKTNKRSAQSTLLTQQKQDERLTAASVDALREQSIRNAFIQDELSKVWKPPLFSGKSVACTVSIFVTRQGSLVKNEIVQSSGVLMYDIAAQQAMAQLQFPLWARGKNMTIVLKT